MGEDLRSSGEGLRGFKSHPRHHSRHQASLNVNIIESLSSDGFFVGLWKAKVVRISSVAVTGLGFPYFCLCFLRSIALSSVVVASRGSITADGNSGIAALLTVIELVDTPLLAPCSSKASTVTV